MKLTEVLSKFRISPRLTPNDTFAFSCLLSTGNYYTRVFSTETNGEVPDINMPDNLVMDRVQLIRGRQPAPFSPDPHPWLDNIREMSRMLSHDTQIPHDTECNVCYRARTMRAEYLNELKRQTNELGAEFGYAPIE